MNKTIDWSNLGFQYIETAGFIRCDFDGSRWTELRICTEPMLGIHCAASCLHYGHACFEGLKAFSRKDGSVAMFRPQENAKRLIASAKRLVMQAPSEELFIEACKKAVVINRDYVPPYGTGASLYIRPLLVGTSARIGLQPSDEFMFLVMVTPVGPYYKNGFYPVKGYVQEDYDRAAPRGVGNIKAAGNYAAGQLGDIEGKKKGYSICLYLDSATRQYIDEFGTSNFFAITSDKRYVTPSSSSILPSITNKSLQQLVSDMGYTVECRAVKIQELESFSEVGACGTAAVITPIYSITFRNKIYTFGKPDKAGETLTTLYKQIQGIQYGEIEDKHGWMMKV